MIKRQQGIRGKTNYRPMDGIVYKREADKAHLEIENGHLVVSGTLQGYLAF